MRRPSKEIQEKLATLRGVAEKSSPTEKDLLLIEIRALATCLETIEASQVEELREEAFEEIEDFEDERNKAMMSVWDWALGKGDLYIDVLGKRLIRSHHFFPYIPLKSS